jgi:two-component system phosphate regulon sensor histidine kinase PhoR
MQTEAWSRLLSIGSHDIRSPLANVRAYASLLLGAKAGQNERTTDYLKVILRNSDKALSLLQEFIDSLMDELGILELNASEQPLAPLLQDALERCRSSAQEKGIQLQASLPPADTSARVDRDRFIHTIAALLEHGIARSPSAGTLRLDASVETGRVRIAVTDAGPAPQADELEGYFDRDRSLTLEGKMGVRFRLSLAAAEIRAHHGELGIRPIAQGGATFLFLLPLC